MLFVGRHLGIQPVVMGKSESQFELNRSWITFGDLVSQREILYFNSIEIWFEIC